MSGKERKREERVQRKEIRRVLEEKEKIRLGRERERVKRKRERVVRDYATMADAKGAKGPGLGMLYGRG